MSEPRPTNVTPEIKLAAAKEVAQNLARVGAISADQIDQSAEEIAHVANRGMDGYEIAKLLDATKLWDCDMSFLEQLDNFSYLVGEQLQAEQAKWAERNNIKPPYPDGTRVRFPEFHHSKDKAKAGVITEVYDRAIACYLIKEDNDSRDRQHLVYFEDVEPIE